MKQFFLVTAFFIFKSGLLACDICGCFMGITPYDNQSSIAFMHRYRVFNGYRLHKQHEHLFPSGAYKVMHGTNDTAQMGYTKTYSSKDFESYKVYELRLKYFIHPRIELNGFLPINANKSKEDTVYREYIGMGDPSFFIGYHLIKRVDFQKFLQRLIIGGGLKIPSGNYYAEDKYKKRLPFLMQPGTGSVDYFTYLNYVLGYKKTGLSINSSYKFNGSNYYKERIANSTSNYLNVFYKFSVKTALVMPSLQGYYEYTKGLYINNVLQAGTEMNVLMGGIGLDVFYKNIGLNFSLQRKLHEKTAPANLASVGRIVVGVSYNFNQRKYLIGNTKS